MQKSVQRIPGREDGFDDGQYGRRPDLATLVIERGMEAALERERLHSSKRLASIRKRLAQAEAAWKEVAAFAEPAVLWAQCFPELFRPLGILLAVVLIVATEVQLLAPLLDGLGITTRIEQQVTSIGIVCVLTLALDLPMLLRRSSVRWTRMLAWATWVVALAALASLSFWRASQMEAMALNPEADSPTLKLLFEKAPALAKLVIALVGSLLPLAASLLLDWGWSKLRLWHRRWRMRLRVARRHRRLVRAQCDLEAETKRRSEKETQLAKWGEHRVAEYRAGFDAGLPYPPISPAQWLLLLGATLLTFGIGFAAVLLPLWEFLGSDTGGRLVVIGMALVVGVAVAALARAFVTLRMGLTPEFPEKSRLRSLRLAAGEGELQ